jgi:spermidine synthase
LLRGAIAAMCLLPPTILMGATLPALSRSVDPKRLGYLYAANISGAVLGCLFAGLYLLRLYDMQIATYAAAGINAAVAIAAFAVARNTACERPPAGRFAPQLSPFVRGTLSEGTAAFSGSTSDLIEPPEAALSVPLTKGDSCGAKRPAGGRSHAIYVAIALSGLCAIAAETVWTRILALSLGGSVYTFTIIVAVFLFGLGLGSAIGSLVARGVRDAGFALGCCQLVTAGTIAWTAYILSSFLPSPPLDAATSATVWALFQHDFNRVLWTLLPATLLWGASFPLALAAASARTPDPGTLMARVYGANTIGAIAGALAASLLLIGRIGSQRIEQLLIALATAAGLLLLLSAKRPLVIAGVSIVAAALLINLVPPISGLLIAHGRYAATWVGKSEIIYAKEGTAASVAVSRFPSGALTFHVAGKIQASSVARDMRLQRMLGHLTSLVAANPQSVLVIGCGAGVTAGAVSIDPSVEQVTIVEIEPLVPEVAATYFSAYNFDVMRNPGVRVRIDDGRHYVLTTKERFDAITLDPLDPWVKGAATLYTKEFFEIVRSHLNPGGVVTVYVQLFETNLEAVKSTVATFFEVFPNGTIWGNTYDGKGHDMVLLGQVGSRPIDLKEMEKRASSPRMAQSLSEIGMNSVLDLFATYAGRRRDLTAWLKDASINLDRNLRMQYLAGLGLDLDNSAIIYDGMLKYRRFPDDLFAGTDEQLQSLRNDSH